MISPLPQASRHRALPSSRIGPKRQRSPRPDWPIIGCTPRVYHLRQRSQLWAALRSVKTVCADGFMVTVPVVAVGAPAGAWICSHMKRHSIVLLLLFLIALEFFSTLLLVPMSRPVLWASLATLAVCGGIDWAMSQTRRYRPENFLTPIHKRESEV